MIIYPAIDILGGKVVRLYKGEYDKVKSYDLTIKEAATSFLRMGAKYLHAVDLDGAKAGKAVNAEAVREIISCGLNVEIGGGIRDEEQIKSYLESGAIRVILGTVAVKDIDFTLKMAKKYPGKIAVGIDALDEKIAINGWKEVTEINSIDYAKRLYEGGIDYIIYTDISRDGTLAGTNMAAYEKLKKISGLSVCASGGITTVEEIEKLRAMGVDAAILGKALYEGKIDLKAALQAAKEA